ncbi:unnamed protein product [Vicia faba]|uniref:Uncharacterized protein n=1 Tax=Vicia faba TaxID=3906 RepID=A0AAV1B3A4_VICFA|nr:unnamed protein product [Vicia faba]
MWHSTSFKFWRCLFVIRKRQRDRREGKTAPLHSILIAPSPRPLSAQQRTVTLRSSFSLHRTFTIPLSSPSSTHRETSYATDSSRSINKSNSSISTQLHRHHASAFISVRDNSASVRSQDGSSSRFRFTTFIRF